MKKPSMLAIAGLSLLASNVMAAVKSEAVQYDLNSRDIPPKPSMTLGSSLTELLF